MTEEDLILDVAEVKRLRRLGIDPDDETEYPAPVRPG
jgi:hypothetical protein